MLSVFPAIRRLPVCVGGVLIALSVALSLSARDPEPIPVITVDDAIINPITSEYILETLEKAESDGSPAFVIELDTPGGLLTSTRTIVKKIMNARIPVIVYVAPSGSRAGSAGVFITLASHVAAMAPSTNIGAAHPVELGESPPRRRESLRDLIETFRKDKKGEDSGGEKVEEPKPEEPPESPMADKILNDTVAWISTIAKERGRNVDWAVRAVKESVSSTEEEALQQGVIDVVAKDLPELVEKIDGKTVKLASGDEIVLDLQGHPLERIGMTPRQQALNVLINPNIAYILMILGFYGLLFEITHPGSWFPGIAGLICLILAFYAFQTLPTNYAGIALIALAVLLFIAEAKVVSYGFLTVGGLACMLLGSLLLFDTSADFLRVSLQLIIPVVVSTGVIFVLLVSLVLRSRGRKGATGVEGMIGEIAEVTVDLPRGKVMVEGEIWDAVSDGPVARGQKVRVLAVNGMVLKVEKI